MRSSCTGAMRAGAATPSERQPAPRELSAGSLHHRRGDDRSRRGQQVRSFRRRHPQCGHRLARTAASGDRARSSQYLHGQCARALHPDGVDRKTGSAGLCQLRHASRRAAAYRRSALDQARLERLVGLRGEQALRCSARVCRRPTLEERPIQRAGAWMGADERWGPFSSGAIFVRGL